MTKNISRLLAVFLAGVMCICSTAPVYALEINDLENADIVFENAITEFEATGEPIIPQYKVLLDGVELVKDVDYVELLENNTAVGTASLSVIAVTDSAYQGKKTVYFTIYENETPEPIVAPKTPSIKACYGEKSKTKLTVEWSKVDCDKYQIMYSKDSSFKSGVKTILVSGSSTKKTFTVKNNNKTYYCKIRAINYDENNKPLYSAWTKKLSSSFTRVYAKYSSKYVNNKDRTTNLRIASKAIDGTVLMPGETFSFNKVVGKRTAAKGYKKAHVFNGPNASSMGIGGGVCQVASTIFNTVLISNLKVKERHQHSQRVAYVPLGRDAAIYWPSQDLKFTNNTNYPIKIKMVVKDGVISCTFLTHQNVKPKKVSIKVKRSGKNFTMKRYVGGKCNYTTKSHY